MYTQNVANVLILRSLLHPTFTHSSSPTLSPTVSSLPTVSWRQPASPIVTFLPIEGLTCSDTCGSERELVDNDNIKDQILKYINIGKMKYIHCLNTTKITNMNNLLIDYQSFNTYLS